MWFLLLFTNILFLLYHPAMTLNVGHPAGTCIFEEKKGFKGTGKQIGFEKANTVEECRTKHCMPKPNCLAVYGRLSSNIIWCVLLEDQAMEADEDSVVWLKVCTEATPQKETTEAKTETKTDSKTKAKTKVTTGCSMVSSIDTEGTDQILTITPSSVSSCEYACSHIQQCKAYISSRNPPECKLFKSEPDKANDDDKRYAVKRTCPNGKLKEKSCCFNILSSVGVSPSSTLVSIKADPMSCSEVCLSMKDCKAASFDVNSGTCKVFTSTDTIKTKPGVTYFRKNCVGAPTNTMSLIYTNVCYNGENLRLMPYPIIMLFTTALGFFFVQI